MSFFFFSMRVECADRERERTEKPRQREEQVIFLLSETSFFYIFFFHFLGAKKRLISSEEEELWSLSPRALLFAAAASPAAKLPLPPLP